MHDRIQKTFDDLKAQKQATIIPYITLGDPDLETSYQTILTLTAAGADMVELGIPFTDPVADGPVIQKACERALKNSFSIDDIFVLCARVREAGVDIPLILMSYANPIYVYGFDSFCKNAVKNGVDGILITDIPPEESEEYCDSARKAGLKTIFLCSPTTSDERLALIDQSSTGFVYYVARAGVTGVQSSMPPETMKKLEAISGKISNRLCIGFGISTPEMAAMLAPHADGIVIGSAIVKLFEKHDDDDLQTQIFTFIDSVKEEASHAVLKY
jgi:tryptophan synthase alpha chain